jgi:PAS domain S-box-containing protein
MALKIDREEALGEVDSRMRRWLLQISLGTLVLGFAVIAVWRHGASERSRAAAAEAAAMAKRFEAQSELLRSVTDSQSARIFIVGKEGRVQFANRHLAEDLGETGAAIEGKRLGAVFGPAGARRYEEALRTTLQRRTAHSATERIEQDGVVRVMRAEFVPVSGDQGVGMLVVEEDITEAVVEREKRARILQEIVDVLVRLVDRRDPFAANHSKRVAAIARELAIELDLTPEVVETAETAGRLMNLGKALVPEILLTKQGRLTDEEHEQVRDALRQGIDMLANIDFGGPVVDTLRQAQERWDGSGPGHLAGEAILMSARIIAVANAFVAMTSPRAHRPGVGIDEAMGQVQGGAGKGFDRRVVAALVNLIENRGGRTRFAV